MIGTLTANLMRMKMVKLAASFLTHKKSPRAARRCLLPQVNEENACRYLLPEPNANDTVENDDDQSMPALIEYRPRFRLSVPQVEVFAAYLAPASPPASPTRVDEFPDSEDFLPPLID